MQKAQATKCNLQSQFENVENDKVLKIRVIYVLNI